MLRPFFRGVLRLCFSFPVKGGTEERRSSIRRFCHAKGSVPKGVHHSAMNIDIT